MGDFELLKPEDIPPRRRSPNDLEDEDLLTKELFASVDNAISHEAYKPSFAEATDDRLTRVIFADVRAEQETVEPQTVDLASTEPPDERSIRQRVLDEIECLDDADLNLVQQYIQRPLLVSKPKKKLPTPEPVRLNPPAGGVGGPPKPQVKYADLPPHPPADSSGALRHKRFPVRKTLLAILVVGFVGLISAISSPSRLIDPIKFSLSSLSGIDDESFLSGVSFILPNNTKLSPTKELLGVILNRDGQYLVLGTDRSRNSPTGGQLETWALVEIRAGTVTVARAGTIAQLNAALAAKIIPPEPIQAIKTSFDFFETSWFFDIRIFARTFGELFTKTTGENAEGIIVISNDIARELASSLGLALDTNDPQWFETLITLLVGRPAADLSGAETILDDALSSRDLQFSRLDGTIVRPSLPPPTKDTLRIGLRSWEDGPAKIELIDYAQEFFVDGSIITTINLNLKNPHPGPINFYTKIAVPRGSILLAEDGYSDPLPIPSFDYAAQGFSPSPDIKQPIVTGADFFPKLDFFEGADFATIGGWVSVGPGETQRVTLRWRLPFRLAWQGGKDTYSLLVWKPPAEGTIPFRYRAAFDESITFSWREPQGYLADNTAEYQTILRTDQTLTAEIRYSQD